MIRQAAIDIIIQSAMYKRSIDDVQAWSAQEILAVGKEIIQRAIRDNEVPQEHLVSVIFWIRTACDYSVDPEVRELGNLVIEWCKEVARDAQGQA